MLSYVPGRCSLCSTSSAGPTSRRPKDHWQVMNHILQRVSQCHSVSKRRPEENLDANADCLSIFLMSSCIRASVYLPNLIHEAEMKDILVQPGHQKQKLLYAWINIYQIKKQAVVNYQLAITWSMHM